jgi:hypothetical protein
VSRQNGSELYARSADIGLCKKHAFSKTYPLPYITPSKTPQISSTTGFYPFLGISTRLRGRQQHTGLFRQGCGQVAEIPQAARKYKQQITHKLCSSAAISAYLIDLWKDFYASKRGRKYAEQKTYCVHEIPFNSTGAQHGTSSNTHPSTTAESA